MSRPHRYILAVLLTLGITSPVLAVHQPSGTNLVEINHHQAAASAALIMGDHTLLEPGEFSFSGDVYVSSWTTDALYGSWGLSFQGSVGQRLVLGLSCRYTDAQLTTRSWLVNAQWPLVNGPDPWWHLQGAIGYQYLDSSESGNVVIFEFDDPWPIRPGNPEILLNDMDWIHGHLNFLINKQFWIVRPQMSLGYTYSHYSWSGWEVPGFGGLEAGLGAELSDSGFTETVTWSLGLGLDLGPVRPYAGIGSFTNGGLMLLRLSFVF